MPALSGSEVGGQRSENGGRRQPPLPTSDLRPPIPTAVARAPALVNGHIVTGKQPICLSGEVRHGTLAPELMDTQGQFSFRAGEGEDGYAQWLVGRQVAADELARRMNLPLGHQVEVWLYGGIRLRGKLRLQEELLFVEEERARHLVLVVDGVPFTYREMESCVRLD